MGLKRERAGAPLIKQHVSVFGDDSFFCSFCDTSVVKITPACEEETTHKQIWVARGRYGLRFKRRKDERLPYCRGVKARKKYDIVALPPYKGLNTDPDSQLPTD